MLNEIVSSRQEARLAANGVKGFMYSDLCNAIPYTTVVPKLAISAQAGIDKVASETLFS